MVKIRLRNRLNQSQLELFPMEETISDRLSSWYVPLRYKMYLNKGCGYWKDDINKNNCSFPECNCFPLWQSKFEYLKNEK